MNCGMVNQNNLSCKSFDQFFNFTQIQKINPECIVTKEENGQYGYDEQKFKEIVEELNKILKGKDTHVEYETYDKIKCTVLLKIVDNKTNKVIQEIPPKKLLDLVARMCEKVGILVDEKA